jgi:NAD(P)-dependent dehydrogenase (short-subunit alcohol dehydrogenase family)
VTRQQQLALLAAVGIGTGLGRVFHSRPRYSFRHRAVMITGGSRGLGLELARVLAAEGAALALVSRDEAELARAHDLLARFKTDVLTMHCDVTDRNDVERAIQHVVDHYGRLDVVINNAGVIQVGPIEHMSVEDFESAMSIHFRGPLYTTLAAIPHMRRQHGGRIVNIASIGGKIPVPHLAPYTASKFALVGLSSSLHAELAKDDIVVTTVCPGLMRTGSPINASIKGQHAREFAWFALGDALPGLSISAQRAARRIVEACRAGRAEHVITLPARAAAVFYGVMPNTFVRLAVVANRLLPKPTDATGDHARLGRDTKSRVAFSRLTRLSDRAAARNNELPRPRPA